MTNAASQPTDARPLRPYRVVVRLKAKSGSVEDGSMSFETLARSAAEAEQAVLAKHHKDWEVHYLMDGIQAVFPADEGGG